MQETFIERFQAEREALLADPQGFPTVRQFAHEHYRVAVVLVDAKEGWANTSLLLLSASPALMDLGAGYCKLNMHRANLLRMFGPAGRGSSVLWVQGVMVHELAKAANNDKEHATVCWIDFASRAALPSSMAALFSWADQLRSQAPCELPRRQAQTPVHAVQEPLQR